MNSGINFEKSFSKNCHSYPHLPSPSRWKFMHPGKSTAARGRGQFVYCINHFNHINSSSGSNHFICALQKIRSLRCNHATDEPHS